MSGRNTVLFLLRSFPHSICRREPPALIIIFLVYLLRFNGELYFSIFSCLSRNMVFSFLQQHQFDAAFYGAMDQFFPAKTPIDFENPFLRPPSDSRIAYVEYSSCTPVFLHSFVTRSCPGPRSMDGSASFQIIPRLYEFSPAIALLHLPPPTF